MLRYCSIKTKRCTRYTIPYDFPINSSNLFPQRYPYGASSFTSPLVGTSESDAASRSLELDDAKATVNADPFVVLQSHDHLELRDLASLATASALAFDSATTTSSYNTSTEEELEIVNRNIDKTKLTRSAVANVQHGRIAVEELRRSSLLIGDYFASIQETEAQPHRSHKPEPFSS